MLYSVDHESAYASKMLNDPKSIGMKHLIDSKSSPVISFFCVPLIVFLFSSKIKVFFLGKPIDFLDSESHSTSKNYPARSLRPNRSMSFTMRSRASP
jgi:hypothetical protein